MKRWSWLARCALILNMLACDAPANGAADLAAEQSNADAGLDAEVGETSSPLLTITKTNTGFTGANQLTDFTVVIPDWWDKVFLVCGDEGQRCCAPYDRNPSWGPHCNTGFGCDQASNTCVKGGTPGAVCLDGPQTCASGLCYSPQPFESPDPTVMCFGGTCNAATHRCETCGQTPGAPCCAPDVQVAVATCKGDNLLCEFGASGDYGTCASCGHVGEQSCYGVCDAYATDVNGRCEPCGRANRISCNGWCEAGTVRDGDSCLPCGRNLQRVCDGNTCASDRLSVFYADGKAYCRACGDEGTVRCTVGAACSRADLVVDGSGYCVHCGGCKRPICTASGMSPCEGTLHSEANICYSEPSGSCPKTPAGGGGGGGSGGGASGSGGGTGSDCECSANSSDPACGMGFGELCSDLMPCKPGMGCTRDKNGSIPYRCRTPEPWERWNCPPVAANGCWKKADAGNCHKLPKED